MSYFATSGSVFAADGVIAHSGSNRFVQLYIAADVDVPASATITMGTPAASVIALLRAGSGQQSPVITLMPSTCLTIAGLEDGDVVALIRKV